MVVHFVPLLESAGISRTTGAAVAGLIGVASILGRLLSGQLLDTYRLQNVGVIFCSLPILAMGLIVLGPTSVPAFSAAALLFGASLGAEGDFVTYAGGRYFQGNNYGVLLGVLMAFLATGGALGPMLGSAIFDRTGNYKLLFLVIPALCACSALFILTLRSPRQPPAGHVPRANR
jgi:predicted MFS family arabinose efflux permease